MHNNNEEHVPAAVARRAITKARKRRWRGASSSGRQSANEQYDESGYRTLRGGIKPCFATISYKVMGICEGDGLGSTTSQ